MRSVKPLSSKKKHTISYKIAKKNFFNCNVFKILFRKIVPILDHLEEKIFCKYSILLLSIVTL